MFKIHSAGGFMGNDRLPERIFTYDTDTFKRMLPNFKQESKLRLVGC
jgi:hypothetical protein